MKLNYSMNDKIFKEISQWLYKEVGIKLNKKKKAMVKSRLTKRLIELGISNFEEYYQLMLCCKGERCKLINLLTTNVTKFFREDYHFQFLEDTVLPKMRSNYNDNKIRVWSAGCSSGEEAYSLAIVLKEFFGDDWDIKVLATDVNTEVLKRASKGIYSSCKVSNLQASLIDKYFKLSKSTNQSYYQVREELREMIIFRKMNLKCCESYQINRKLDLIFCRNVFIYFDNQLKKKIIDEFYNNLKNRQYLFLGNSDSVDYLIKDDKGWRLVYPTTYQKL